MKLPNEAPVMTRPNLTRFPQTLRETVGVEARRQRLLPFMFQEIRKHRKDSRE